MADNILRLKVESSEYDAKLKKAAEGIRHLADVAHHGGGELTGLEKAELDYIKSLGSMETKSRTAAGSVRELENTFKELTVVYNQLNDVEKQDEGGKALAASLETLKQRALDAKAGLNEATQALQGNEQSAAADKGGIDGLTSALGINVKSLAGWGAALTAGKVALDVAKDAFMSSETNVDDWGRTVRSAEGIYQSFVQSLNTGDFTGFLNNIGRVTQAAQEAYNALDELGTRMTIINPERARLQARQQELRADIRRNGADSEVGRAALAELKKIEPLLSKSFKTESQMNYTAFEKLVRERLAEGGINLNQRSFEQFMKTFSSDAAFQNLRRNARGSSELRETSEIGKFRTVDTRNIEQKLLDLFTDEWRQANSGYLTASFSAQGAAASNALGNARYMRAGSGGGKGGKGGKTDKNLDAEQQVQQKINDLLKEALTADANRQGEIRQQVAELQKQQEKYKDIKNIAQGILPKDKVAVFTIDGQLSEETKKNLREIENVTIDDKTMTVTADTQEAMQKVQELIGQVSTTTLQMKVAPPDLDKLFPDLSKENYNTGYAGSAQAKYDSARVDLALGPMNFDAISNYISGIKNALSNANLGDELYNSMTEKLKDATTVSTLLQEMMERGLAGADLETTAQALKEKLLSPEGIDQTAIQSFLEGLNEQIEEAGGVGLKLNADTGEVTDDKGNGKNDGEELKKFNEGIGKLTGGLSQVTGGLKAVGVEIPKEVDQVLGVINGVSQIISGVGTIISIFGTSAITANTTAVGVNTATMVGLIAALEVNTATNFIPFANGGIVPAFAHGGLIGRAAGGLMIPGNSMSGDRLRLPVDGGLGMIGVNSGELILNRAQQGNLASQLEGGVAAAANTQPFINGEQIYLGLQAYMRRSGLGEIVTAER